jgi:transcriptional regulator GlxA family with amidase domain
VDHSIADHPPLGLLVVPGGDVSGMLADPDVAPWIVSVAAGCGITASVCTGAFLLAQAGLLDGRRATTHWEDVDGLSSQWPTIDVLRDVRWVDEGSIVTAAGVSAGIDMALHLVERLAGRELALRTARHMEYTWAERA